MSRLYSKENFPRQVVQELRQRGHDVLTVLEAGKAEQAIADVDVLAFAVEQDRAVITLNRKHFIRLHQQQPEHEGIIVCSFDPDFSSMAARIDLELQKHPHLAGVLLRINRPHS